MITVKKQLFDLAYLKQINDQALIAEVINLYLTETQTGLLKMNWAFDTSDYDTIHAITDQLKSSSGLIQANAFYAVLEEIEKISKYGSDSCQLNELGHLASYEFYQLKYELELYLKS